MVVDNGQVGFLSEVQKYGAFFTPLPLKPEQEKRAMLYITLSETISNSITRRLKRMKQGIPPLNTSTSIVMSLWTDTATSTRSRTPSLSLWTPTAVTHSHWSVVRTGILSRLIYSTTRYPSQLMRLLLSIHLWRRYQRRLINMEVNLEYMGSLVDMEQDAMIESLVGHIYSIIRWLRTMR